MAVFIEEWMPCRRRQVKRMGENRMISKPGALIVALALLAVGCKIKFGTTTDSATGMSITSDGLSYKEVVVNVGDARLESDEVKLGANVVLVYTGVKGFMRQNGRVFPGASMTVTGQDGTTIGDYRDLFANYTAAGMDPGKASRLTITLATGRPMVPGKSYFWKVRVWDKKGAGEIVSEMNMKMK